MEDIRAIIAKFSAVAIWALCFIVLCLAFGALYVPIAVDANPLNPSFRFMLSVIAAMTASTAISATMLLYLFTKSWSSGPGSRGSILKSRVGRVVLLVGVLGTAVAVLYGAYVRPAPDESRMIESAAEARDTFGVVWDAGNYYGRVHLNPTLAEFQQAHEELLGRWTAPVEAPKIVLHIFGDMGEFRDAVLSDILIGATRCYMGGLAVILVPLRESAGALSRASTDRHPSTRWSMLWFAKALTGPASLTCLTGFMKEWRRSMSMTTNLSFDGRRDFGCGLPGLACLIPSVSVAIASASPESIRRCSIQPRMNSLLTVNLGMARMHWSA